jgi:glycerol-3-phosphate acyltransferase PlsY
MTAALWTLVGFVSGSIMYALWLGKLALRRDIREVGDGNPGAFNILKAGGVGLGAAAMLLDALKGAIPVGLARWGFGISGAPLVAVALAPVFGHAFSPWLRFKGGKAVAVTFGIWTGLTIWEAPTFMGLLLGLAFSLVSVSGWAVLWMMACIGIYFLITYPDPVWLTIWLINTLILAYKYRDDLRQPLALRPAIQRLLWRSA